MCNIQIYFPRIKSCTVSFWAVSIKFYSRFIINKIIQPQIKIIIWRSMRWVKYFTPITIILYSFFKSFVSSFGDINLTSSNRWFSAFSASMCCFFVCSNIFINFFFSFSSKSVFFMKSAISFLVASFACFSSALTFSTVNVLNYWVICLSWSWL